MVIILLRIPCIRKFDQYYIGAKDGQIADRGSQEATMSIVLAI